MGELPARWNELYSKYLGVEIENDAEGVLQDTHWAGDPSISPQLCPRQYLWRDDAPEDGKRSP